MAGIRSIGHRLRQYFFAGIATIFPVMVTIYVILFIFKHADNILGKFINMYLVKNYGYKIPGLGILLGFILTILVGVVANHFIGKRLIPFLERYFLKLPFIRHVYSPAKQLSDFLFKEDGKQKFKKVVLAQYPSEGSYSLGFMTNEDIEAFDSKLDQKVVTVLISTPPNPFTGPLVLLPRDKIKVLDMSMEAALKFVVSGGLAAPREKREKDKGEKGSGLYT